MKWLLNTVYAPGSVTTGETFLWHNVDDRLQVGVALLWKQGAFRGLANYKVVPETAKTPSFRLGFGLQGIAVGNPGYFATSEKSFRTEDLDASAYVGLGFRTNENHGHLLGGLKLTPKLSAWTIGAQLDGHQNSPFLTFRVSQKVNVGYYWIDTKSSGYMLSIAW